jgi:hypothetical protein
VSGFRATFSTAFNKIGYSQTWIEARLSRSDLTQLVGARRAEKSCRNRPPGCPPFPYELRDRLIT